MRYVPALDGLRAVAVIAVVLFHGDLGVAPGGFLGVSLFFTLSGFLITTLLLHEHEAAGRISLSGFYERRIRRLLPAAVCCLLLVAVLAGSWSVAQQRNLPGDLVAAMLNVANWRFAFSSTTYAELLGADPSPVAHFWSLAIEEQVYLVLPLVVVVCLRRGRGALAVAAGSLLVLSVAASVLTTDRNLVYNGTHTRAAEVLVGVLVALAVARRATAAPSHRWSWMPGAAAAAAFGALVAAATIDQAWVYGGGLVVVALVSAVLIVAVADGRFPARLLELPALVSIGRVSYGIYLFHWPVFVFLDAGRVGLDGPALFVLRCLVTAVLTVVSYVLVEQPIRSGRALPGRRTVLSGAGVGTAAVLVVALVWVPTPARTATEEVLALGAAEVVRFAPVDAGAGTGVRDAAPAPTDNAPTNGDRVRSASDSSFASAFPPSMPPTSARPGPVLVVGSDEWAAAVLAERFDVIDASDPTCPINTIDACAPIAERIEPLLVEHRPMVVVIAVGEAEEAVAVDQNASATDAASLHALAAVHQQVIDDLLVTIDRSADDGAAVVLSSSIGRFTATYPRLARVALVRPDVGSVAVDADSLLEQVERSSGPEASATSSLRLLVVGDSTSLSLAQALNDGSDGRLAVTWAGSNGCPLAAAEAIRLGAGDPWRPLDCPDYVEKIAPIVEADEPDALIVMTGAMDQYEVRFADDAAGYTAADPQFRAARSAALEGLLEVVGPELPVLVADFPQVEVGAFAAPEMLEPARLAALNAQVDEWDSVHPQVQRLDYRRVLEEREAERGSIRTDGVHPDAIAFEELAREVLVAQIIGQVTAIDDRLRLQRSSTPG